MKTGDRVWVREGGQREWVETIAVLCSANGASLALKGENLSKLGGNLVVHPDHGKMLLLLRTDEADLYLEFANNRRFHVMDELRKLNTQPDCPRNDREEEQEPTPQPSS